MPLSVATWSAVTVFVMPGPEPTTTTPGRRFCQPHAEAMKAAFSSCRQPTTRSPSACAPAKTWIIGPATTPKIVSIPAARSCRAASLPPSISELVAMAASRRAAYHGRQRLGLRRAAGHAPSGERRRDLRPEAGRVRIVVEAAGRLLVRGGIEKAPEQQVPQRQRVGVVVARELAAARVV